MNTEEIAEIVDIEDKIDDSGIVDRYDLFVSKSLGFIEKCLIPLSREQGYLKETVQYSRAYRQKAVDGEQLKLYAIDFNKKLLDIPNKQEKAIAKFIYWFVDEDFLNGITPEWQQDSSLSYMLDALYEVCDDLSLCKKFCDFLLSEQS